MKYKKTIFIFLFLILPFIASAAGPFDYTPMENIPGSDDFTSKPTDFYTYIAAVYKFGIWAVGIAALFMIIVGGYMYITSAGNNSSMEKAKGIISDAIIGLLLALTAYLLLYIINPDLVKVKKLQPLGTTGKITGGAGTGKCKPISSGPSPCTVEKLKNSCFKDVAEQASAICNAESGGSEGKKSLTDICKGDGASFSVGLFQINMTCQCPDAFNPKTKANGKKGCVNYECSVSDQSIYKNCLLKYTSPDENISKACEIYKIKGWSSWGANRDCGF